MQFVYDIECKTVINQWKLLTKQTRPPSPAAIVNAMSSSNNNNYSNTFKSERNKKRAHERVNDTLSADYLSINCSRCPFLALLHTGCQPDDCVCTLIANHLVKHIGNFWRHFGVLFAIVVVVVNVFHSRVTFIDPLLLLLLLFSIKICVFIRCTARDFYCCCRWQITVLLTVSIFLPTESIVLARRAPVDKLLLIIACVSEGS